MFSISWMHTIFFFFTKLDFGQSRAPTPSDHAQSWFLSGPQVWGNLKVTSLECIFSVGNSLESTAQNWTLNWVLGYRWQNALGISSELIYFDLFLNLFMLDHFLFSSESITYSVLNLFSYELSNTLDNISYALKNALYLVIVWNVNISQTVGNLSSSIAYWFKIEPKLVEEHSCEVIPRSARLFVGGGAAI